MMWRPLFLCLLVACAAGPRAAPGSTSGQQPPRVGSDASPADAAREAGEPPPKQGADDASNEHATKPDAGSLAIDAPADCAGLFGRPSENTGLTNEQCKPECSCGDGVFRPPAYDEDDLAALEAWTLLNPPAELTDNPYDAPAGPASSSEQVCAFMAEDPQAKTYRLMTFDDVESASSAGGIVTHTGACGLCSSLRDLAVYIRRSDLTTPVRQCGLDHIAGPKDQHIACLEALGFQPPCAQIWYYNTVHTRNACLVPCLGGLNAKYHEADGTLSACIQCDEDKSGPVFKAVAGRTRRNSGLPSALCRPCNTVSRIVHRY